MSKRQCPGVGQSAAAHPDDIYPYCPVCDKQLAAQGHKAQRRYANAWQQVPRHFAPEHIAAGIAQGEAARVRFYRSDALGAVTIPEE